MRSVRKKKILFCGEATYLNTGYATYNREVIKRLFATGKYDIAEFASYGSNSDPRRKKIPWTFYGNMPDKNNEKEVSDYESVPTNQFGEWKFESVLLDFKPDIVCDIRDFWMMDFQQRSPFRRMFHWAIMPTVDAHPQNEQWLETYCDADAVFSYSDWGGEVIKEETNNNAKYIKTAPPSADSAYIPVEDKIKHKEKMGFSADSLIIGTVMRNQKRKLFPDLFKTFRMFLDKSQNKDVFLYCHTSYPDLGWDIPKLIHKYGLSSKVLFTYVCQNCGHCFPMFFSDARTKCPKCKSSSAGLSNVQQGVSYEFLADIMNCFDLYIQYANSEGFGLPQVEAAACGVPVMSVDYSAMSSVIRKLGGTPLKLASVYNEVETGCDRAVPDNDYASDQIVKFFEMSEKERLDLGEQTRKNFEKYYQWDDTAKIWEEHFDSIEIRPEEETWSSPPRLHSPATSIPAEISDRDFIKWLIVNVLGEPEKLNTLFESRMIRDLNYGYFKQGTGNSYLNEDSLQFEKPDFVPFEKEQAYNIMAGVCHHRNEWEQRRISG